MHRPLSRCSVFVVRNDREDEKGGRIALRSEAFGNGDLSSSQGKRHPATRGREGALGFG